MMLTVENLSVANGARVTFEAAAGQCLGLHGPSGSGKSLILRAIADLDVASGQVHLDGHAMHDTAAPAWRRDVCYVPPVPSFWTTTGRDALPHGVDVALGLGLNTDRLDAPIAELSSGERQRVALARALAPSPKVLLADEPTSALDASAVSRVEAILRGYMAAGGILVLVSHDADLLGQLSGGIVDVEAT